MGDQDEYRRNAADCLHWARAASDPEIQAMFLNMAHAWARLAEQAERNSKGYGPAVRGKSQPSAPKSDEPTPE
jgi:hypothetical protein